MKSESGRIDAGTFTLIPVAVIFSMGWVLATIWVQHLPDLPSVWLVPPAVVLLPLLLRQRRWLWLGFLAGSIWASGCAALRLASGLTDPERLQARVEGQVLNLPEPMDRGVRFDFRIDRVLQPQGARLPDRVRVSWYELESPPRAGERWVLWLSLRPPRGMSNPGGFDYEQWLFAQGIGGLGYVRTAAGNRRLAPAPFWLPASWRQRLSDRLGDVLAGSPVLGLIEALTLGVEDRISRPQWEVLRRTGTTHLIAISGSHVGLIAGAAYFLALHGGVWLGLRRWSPPSVAAAVAATVAVFYSALANFAIPTQRALIMIAVTMGAVVARRNADPLQVLAMALLAVTLYDPWAVLAPGFWLSFGAVALIALTLSGRLLRPGFGKSLLLINWVTAIGLAPLLLLFFGQVSLVSPLANLLAVPVLGTLLIPLCLLGALLLPIWPAAGTLVLQLAETVLRHFWPLLEWLSDLEYVQWTQAEPPAWTLIFALLGCLLLIAPRGIPARGLGLVLLLPALTHQPQRPHWGEFRLMLLDVGQGLAAVIETTRRALVFDTGARLGPGFDMGSAVIEPYLRWRGIDHLDALVVSHGDDDHIGGARSLLERLPVAAIYTSVPDQLPGYPARLCGAGQSWEWEGVRFDMLGPVTWAAKENDNSCVLRVQGPGGSALLTGDIEEAGERYLLQRYGQDLRSRILIAPHHGSNTSSTVPFLTMVQPELVLIPTGYLNRFGFPHPAVVRRYSDRGVALLTTAAAGAISVEVRQAADPLQPRRQRRLQRRYWQVP